MARRSIRLYELTVRLTGWSTLIRVYLPANIGWEYTYHVFGDAIVCIYDPSVGLWVWYITSPVSLKQLFDVHGLF